MFKQMSRQAFARLKISNGLFPIPEKTRFLVPEKRRVGAGISLALIPHKGMALELTQRRIQ
jgi:hypothetical protein